MKPAQTVWKYGFPVDDHFTIDMPIGAEPLCVMLQKGERRPQMWVRVDPKAPAQTRRFRVAGTGHPLLDDVGPYVGSFQMLEGEFVFHVFEENRR